MAYFNFTLAEKNRIPPEYIVYLQLIKQNKHEDLGNIIEKTISNQKRFLELCEEKELITIIKGKASQSTWSRIRLSKKGESFLDMYETPEVIEDDMKILHWLINIYSLEDKAIGNKKRIASGIAHFRKETGIMRNDLALLLKTFVNDEKNFEYSQRLENLFFNNKNIYQRRFILDDCKLYEYYLKNKERLDIAFKQNESRK